MITQYQIMKMNHRLLRLISLTILLTLISVAFYGIHHSFDNINKKLDKVENTIRQVENNMDRLITQHSVHPYYGNYVKLDDSGNTCHPWQYCPGNKCNIHNISLMRKIYK